jgi:hypothetical protein
MSAEKTVLAAIVFAVVVVGCGSLVTSPGPTAPRPSPSVASDFVPTQRNEGGQVTVEVTWDGPAAGAVFKVQLDTHSIDLDGIDLSAARLMNDRGERLVPAPWEAPKGGHHREGRLAFVGNAQAFLADARWVELTIVDVGAVPARVLRWEVPV